MSDEPDSLVLRYLRAIDAKLDRVIDDVRDLKIRVTALEHQVTLINGRIDHLASRMDRIDDRLDRIERRLGLVDAPPL